MNLYRPPIHTALDIVYQDDYIIAVNKPSGLLSVPGRGEDKQDCMLNRVQQTVPEAKVVHRLDMGTSGILLMARSHYMQRELSQLFQKRQISKTYVAIVDGRIQESCGEIDLPLASDWPNRPKQKIDFIRGKPSKTHYQVQSYNVQKNTTYLQLKPLTGRSHQLRVHLLAVGHAIVGDDLYANIGEEASSCRLMLHSTSLNFIHPYTSMEITLRCAAPF